MHIYMNLVGLVWNIVEMAHITDCPELIVIIVDIDG